jgi:hypothetical protein
MLKFNCSDKFTMIYEETKNNLPNNNIMNNEYCIIILYYIILYYIILYYIILYYTIPPETDEVSLHQAFRV